MRLDHVTKGYSGRTVLRDFSLELPERGFCCVLGPSGAGKTTLLRLLAGLEEPDSGQIRRSGPVSMVFQEDRLLPWETALDNAALAGEPGRARELLVRLGLGDWLDRRPGELSGGMCRRVAIARALAAPAGVYLMDEPLKGLDSQTRALTMEVIRQETKDALLVLVTHQEEDAAGADLVIRVEQLG